MSRLNLRRLTTICCCSALLLVLGSSAASALSVSYTDNTISFPLSPGADIGSVPQWDPALFPGQTLVSVELYINMSIGANVNAENDSLIPGNMGVNLSGFVTGTAPGLSATALIAQGAGPVAVSATDGTPGSGPDFVNFGAILGNDDDTDITGVVGPYIGAGSIAVTVNGNGGFAVSGVSDSTINVSGFGGTGLVTVTYNYVPEPGSIVLALMGACGVAAAVWRRRRK